jgi:hypothetical protein
MNNNVNLSLFHNIPVYNFYPPLKKQITISNFKVKVIEMQLFEFVRIAVVLIDNEGNIIEQKFYRLEDEDYQNWSNDDTFIVNYVRKQLRGEYEIVTATNVVTSFKNALKKKSDDKPQDEFIVDPQLNS